MLVSGFPKTNAALEASAKLWNEVESLRIAARLCRRQVDSMMGTSGTMRNRIALVRAATILESMAIERVGRC
jgi:hypothetical protein